MEWSNEQKIAINTQNANLLVSAGAGAGKTAVLTRRIVDQIVAGNNVSSFLVITFTKASALEMRQRIHKELIKEQKTNPKMASHIRKQIEMLPLSNISTIDSFCKMVVQENFEVLGLPVKINILTDMIQATLKNQAMNNTLEYMYGENEDFKGFAKRFAPNSDEPVTVIVNKLYQSISSMDDPNAFLNKMAIQYKDILIEDYLEIIRQHIKSSLIAQKLNYQLILKDFVGLESSLESQYNIYCDEYESIKNAIAVIDHSINFQEVLDSIVFPTLRWPKDMDKDDEFKLKMVKKRNETKEYIKKQKELVKSIGPIEDIKKTIKEMAPYVNGLKACVQKYIEEYSKLKLEQSKMDFSDLEHFALEILKDEKTAKTYKEKFKFIYIDEYQDTNQLQDALVKQIAGDDNVFMVGDIKQSIYKFRDADPNIFLEKYNTFKSVTNAKNIKVALNKNYRSQKNILNFINLVFGALMGLGIGGVNYDDDAMLKPGLDEYESDNIVEVHTVDSTMVPEEMENMVKAELEANVVGDRILQLIKDGEQFKDITILMRSPNGQTNPAQIFKRILEDKQIPAFVTSQGNDKTDVEVQAFINLLKIIDNKMEDIPLISVLYSRLFNFTTDELAIIRSEKCKYYHECLMAYGKNQNDVLSNKINIFLEKISVWKKRSRKMSVEQLISTIFEETGYLETVTHTRNGNKKVNALYQLMIFAREFEQTGNYGLYAFMDFYSRLEKTDKNIELASFVEGDQVVKIMSIHHSKGLEFKNVFLSMMDNKPLKTNTTDFNINSHLGIGVKYIDIKARAKAPTLFYTAIELQNKYEDLAESLRVLYVGMTRAKAKLIITGCVKGDVDVTAPLCTANLIAKNNALLWVLMGLNNNGRPGVDYKVFNHDLGSYHLKKTSQKNTNLELKEQKIDWVENNLSVKKEYTIKNIATKVSVTSIIKDGASIYTPKVKSTNTINDSAKIGTITHGVLAAIDEKNANEETYISDLLKSLVEKNFYTLDEINLIDKKLLDNYCKSSIFKDVQKSSLVYKEKAFILSLKAQEHLNNTDNDILVQGVIDCAFLVNDEFVVVDFKTDNVKSDFEKTARVRYEKQLELYSTALTRLTGKPVTKKIIYFLKPNKIIEL